ncbi:uncharacterized protein RAG0_14509 [Rhynchosporium agropyri]|uniref:Uncharacterized protein n=1 Tax=Rhynchosporium agropyri TaxID=914238 RepID=A0A1E1LHC6_9HELO|nr:uncharacterized protein RAG0_14509 [Rhynchosporium agropyri]
MGNEEERQSTFAAFCGNGKGFAYRSAMDDCMVNAVIVLRRCRKSPLVMIIMAYLARLKCFSRGSLTAIRSVTVVSHLTTKIAIQSYDSKSKHQIFLIADDAAIGGQNSGLKSQDFLNEISR